MPDSSALSRLLTLKQVRHLAGERSFQRGRDYFDGGQVRSLVAHGDTLTATVTGSQNYAVRLAAKDNGLSHRCSCPVGGDGLFCKHCVAVGLAWLDAGRDRVSNLKSGISNSSGLAGGLLVTLDDLRPWLLAQAPATLAAYLLETAERDDRLREKLLRAAARATAKGVDFSAYRKSIDRATRTGGFIDYDGAGGFAEGVREAIEPLRELLAEDSAHAGAAIDLTEHALERVEDAMESADDSNGEIGALLAELQELHLEACRVAKPDPEELARRLFEWEMADHWDVFYNAAETYAELLGETGLATYRRLAEAAWQKLPALSAGDERSFDSGRFRLTNIMEALARTTGDLEALVTVKAKDLSHAYNYLQIAELFHSAKQPDSALDWAERGLKAFPRDTDPRLLVFVADGYHRRRRHDDALALVWRIFDAHPSLENFQLLKKHAALADAWPAWRERALVRLGTTPKIANRHGAGFDHVFSAGNRATLIRIFLWEKDVDAAWREAQAGSCPDDLWHELAAAREATRPADTLPVYLRLAENCIGRANKPAYEEAVRLLRKAKKLFLALDRPADWDAALARLRGAHKAKRNFIALAATM